LPAFNFLKKKEKEKTKVYANILLTLVPEKCPHYAYHTQVAKTAQSSLSRKYVADTRILSMP